MEGQLAEMKATEARITVATQQKDDAQAARFKGLVTMYENMKPRDAAKIFDRLDAGACSTSPPRSSRARWRIFWRRCRRTRRNT